jgi:site-specific DNA-methyltransferase (adenine-specific)
MRKILYWTLFIGSGTSARVCQQLNRNIIGIDINKNYIEMTKKRLQKHFYGFDSIDERLIRIPNDLNNIKIREQYVKNHINWFLKNNKNQIGNFMSKYILKYSAKNKIKDEQNINLSLFDFRS